MAYTAGNTQGVKEARARLTKFIKTLETVPTQELEKEANTLYRQIWAETPYKSGKLRDSVRVRVLRSKRSPGLSATASARFKGFNYSWIQHENKRFKHVIGKSHYVRDPFRRAIRRLERNLASKVKY